MDRKTIGLKDRKGKDIRVGDVVEFYFCADHGAFATKKDGCECGGTRMVDEVVEEDGEFFFVCPGIGGAFAWRYSDVCRVIGSLPDDAEMFWKANNDMGQDAPKETTH